MEAKKIYRHKNCRDTAIKILSTQNYEKYGTLFVMWLNVHPNDLGCNPPYELYYDTIEIKKEDLQNWIEYDTEQQYGVLNENSKRDN